MVPLRAWGLALVLVACVHGSATATTLPQSFEARTLASGLDAPIGAAWAPDGRLFVAEFHGRVRTVVGGELLPEPLIDISDHVNAHWDRGLLGIAVDSDFETNHFLYLLYVYDDGSGDPNGPMTSRLTRVVVRPDNTVANPDAPETVILGADDDAPCPAPSNEVDCIPADYASHAIGTVRADPDGSLWVGSGDAAVANQADEHALRAYDPTSYAGKILHVDRAGRGLPGHPYCPSDDDLTHTCTKVFASGLRNPYRFVLRDGGLGPIVGDVGNVDWDEIDLAAPGLNYGWPCWEGPAQTPSWREHPACADVYAAGGTTPPDFAYAGIGEPTGGGNTVVGGPLYPGGEYPDDFDGEILFGDWAQGLIQRLRLAPDGPTVGSFATGVQALDLQLAPSGNLAYVEAGTFAPGEGVVEEIAYCPVNCAPLARATAQPSFGPAPLEVSFTGDRSSDPEGLPLTYDWDFGDGSPHSSSPNPAHEYADDGVYLAVLTVTDIGGRTSNASVPVSVGNVPPRPSIDGPADGSLYVAGQPVQLSGSALDTEEGVVPSDDLEWRVLLHHGDHIHPGATLTGATATFTPGTDHDADSYFEVVLTARDGQSLSGETSIALRPRTVPVRLESSPPGGPLTWASASVVAPFAAISATGFRTTVSAASTFTRDGRTYAFDGWSDGGARHHDLTVPSDGELQLVARYRDVTPPPGPSPDAGPVPDPPDPPDVRGPNLTFDAGAAAMGRLKGTAVDPSGVRSVEVALRAPRRLGGGCRWWLVKQRRLAHRREPCGSPRWIATKLTGDPKLVSWRAALGGTLAGSSYEIVFRALDQVGNLTRTAGERSRTRFAVRNR